MLSRSGTRGGPPSCTNRLQWLGQRLAFVVTWMVPVVMAVGQAAVVYSTR